MTAASVTMLSFKRVVPGQTFLACIKQVRDFDLLLSLPGRLFGTVPCNLISPTLTDIFSRFAEDDSEGAVPPSLQNFYKAGEFVVCVVKSVRETEKDVTKKVIELSMLPSDIQKDLQMSEMVNGMVVMGSIMSKQDRGFVVDFGFAQGFCQFNKCDSVDSMTIGKTVMFTLLLEGNKPSTGIVQLSAKQNRLGELFLRGEAASVAQRSLLPGNLLEVIVKEVQEHRVLVSCPGGGMTAYMDNLSSIPSTRTLQVGDKCKCRLVWCGEQGSACMSARESVLKLSINSTAEESIGSTIIVKSKVIDPKNGILFASSQHGDCFAHRSSLFETDAELQKVNWKVFEGKEHSAKVIGHDWFSGLLLLSLQPSIVSAKIISYTDVKVGDVVKGEVVKHGDYGIVVKLSDKVKAICPLFHLSDTHAASSKLLSKFAIGNKYRFRVLESDPQTRQVTLCRRQLLIDSTRPQLITLSQAKPNQQYDGYVVSVNEKGAIVRFYGTLTALLPVHELVEGEFVESAKDHLRVGQSITVRAKVVDVKKARFVVSLKSEESDNKQQALRKVSVEPDVSLEPVQATTENVKRTVPVPAEEPKSKKLKTIFEEMSDIEEPTASLVTNEEPPKTEKRGNKKSIVDEYEKRLLATPNASVVWIEYAAALVEVGLVEEGREILERALRTISIREQSEKLNCWTALLNIENIYGNGTSLRACFERALRYCEPKHLYLRLCDIYCHNGKQAEAHELFEEMQRKFKTSCKVWLAAILFYMTKSRDLAAARRLLPLALKALPSRKHVKVTLKTAQLEYKHGELERARTLFEGLLAAHPKRIDLWLVYVQMEENLVKSSTNAPLDHVRRIYERALTMRLSSKKAKTFFKSFLAFEKECGDAASVEHVKQLARDYVEGKN